MDLLDHQADFIESDALHTGIVGGFRSGKSQAGVLKTVLKKLSYPGIDVAYYLPTYGLIKDVAHKKFKEILDAMGVGYTLHETDHVFHTDYGKIFMRSMDKPDTIIGYEVGYSLIDEADVPTIDHMRKVFIKVLARLSEPLPDGKANSLDFVSTPEGFKFLHEFFVKNKSEDRVLIKASTRNNPFISKSYIDTLEKSYTTEQLQAYLDGEFVNLTTGTVLNRFDRTLNHTERTIQPRDILHVGMDFNVTRMAAVVHVAGWQTLEAVDEFVNMYDTEEMCAAIKKAYPGHQIIVYPDASGKNRNTSSTTTDHDIIKSYRFKIKTDKTNPAIKDRITTMNLGFRDNDGVRRYKVNTTKCPSYTEGLEQLPYKNGLPDKSSGHDHVVDGGGYCAWHKLGGKKSRTTRIYS